MMSDTNDAVANSGRLRRPATIGPCSKLGAYIADCDEGLGTVRRWLKHYSLDATAYSSSTADELVLHIAEGRFGWIAFESSGYALKSPWFDRLFRGTIESNTEVWTASDDTEFGQHLFCSMLANGEFLAPYMPESTADCSLTSIRDALLRLEQRIQANASEAISAEAIAVEGSTISPQSDDGLIVKDGLVIDKDQFTVAYRDKKCFLGNTILFYLAERLGRTPGKWFSFGELKDDVWDVHTVDSTVGRTLRRLRQAMKEAGVIGIAIDTPRNMAKYARLRIL